MQTLPDHRPRDDHVADLQVLATRFHQHDLELRQVLHVASLPLPRRLLDADLLDLPERHQLRRAHAHPQEPLLPDPRLLLPVEDHVGAGHSINKADARQRDRDHSYRQQQQHDGERQRIEPDDDRSERRDPEQQPKERQERRSERRPHVDPVRLNEGDPPVEEDDPSGVVQSFSHSVGQLLACADAIQPPYV